MPPPIQTRISRCPRGRTPERSGVKPAALSTPSNSSRDALLVERAALTDAIACDGEVCAQARGAMANAKTEKGMRLILLRRTTRGGGYLTPQFSCERHATEAYQPLAGKEPQEPINPNSLNERSSAATIVGLRAQDVDN